MIRSFGLLAVALASCSDYGLAPGVDPNLAGDPEIEVRPLHLDFGHVDVGFDRSLSIEVRNIGGSDLVVDELEVDGPFHVVLDAPGFRLVPDDARTVPVRYAPERPRDDVGEVRVLSNDRDESIVPVSLAGGGVSPWLRITPETHDFGTVLVPCQDEVDLVLQNIGNRDLHVSGIGLDGDAALALAGAPGLPLVLAPGATSHAQVSLAADTERSVASTLWTTSDDPRGRVEATQVGSLAWTDEVTDDGVVPADPPVDILFAVDQSGSMDDDASRLGAAFDTFIRTLAATTDDWHLGVATWDHGCFNGGVLDTSSPDLAATFEAAVQEGDDRAIADDEALFSIVDRSLRQSVRGGCNEGFLRPGAALHVVVVSDEPERSVERSSSLTWDTFVARFQAALSRPGLLVVSGVVDVDPCYEGAAGYVEAIEATGGAALSVCSADWGSYAETLAEVSLRYTKRLDLSRDPVPSTLVVRVDGIETTVGWRYDAAANAVVFEDLGAGTRVEASYRVLAECL